MDNSKIIFVDARLGSQTGILVLHKKNSQLFWAGSIFDINVTVEVKDHNDFLTSKEVVVDNDKLFIDKEKIAKEINKYMDELLG